ncbi:Metallo-hydrolase/oxidoreductase [Meredithblackwellia eburnea MCA 4105]
MVPIPAGKSTHWDREFVPPWHGFPSGEASCSVHPLCQSTLLLIENEVLSPGRAGVITRRPSLSFLITRSNGERAIFDLGVPLNWLSLLPESSRKAYEDEFQVEISRSLDELLLRGPEGPVDPASVGTLIISHKHWDHTGSPSSFPNAKVYVGEGDVKEIPALASHKNIFPITWDPSIHPPIGAFSHSLDLFADGSVLILDAPGHTPGHIGALIRTNPGEYVLLFADGCHHHKLQSVNPDDQHYTFGAWRDPGDPEDEPASRSYYEDYTEASRTVLRMKAMERRPEVMVVSAHNEVLWDHWGGKPDSWCPDLKGWKSKGLKLEY